MAKQKKPEAEFQARLTVESRSFERIVLARISENLSLKEMVLSFRREKKKTFTLHI